MVVAEALIVTSGTSVGFTVIFTCELVAVKGDAQVAFEVITTENLSPLAAVVVE